MKKIWGPKLGPKFGFLPFSQSCIIRLVFLDIAQDCSLGQCLSSSKAEISLSKKKKKKKIESKFRNDLFYSNVVDHPLRLACQTYFL